MEGRAEARSRDESAEPRALEDSALTTGTKCKRAVNAVPVPLRPGQGTFLQTPFSSLPAPSADTPQSGETSAAPLVSSTFDTKR